MPDPIMTLDEALLILGKSFSPDFLDLWIKLDRQGRLHVLDALINTQPSTTELQTMLKVPGR